MPEFMQNLGYFGGLYNGADFYDHVGRSPPNGDPQEQQRIFDAFFNGF